MNQDDPTAGPWLGLDIGGANIKLAHESGAACSIPFPLWRNPGRLPAVLADALLRMPPARRFAAAMTGELCDCFRDKAEGVTFILNALSDVMDPRLIRVWGLDSCFHDVQEILGHPEWAHASNWLALAEVAARRLQGRAGLLIDIGSTTTDIIPLAGGRALPRARTDTERLSTGELIYAGVSRTPVFALASELPYRGIPTGLAAEFFATTRDVYLTLGSIPPDPADLDTADGRPATVEAARHRLARVISSDGRAFTPSDATDLARAADEALLARLESAGRRVVASLPPCDGSPTVVIAGSGEFLARRLAHRLLPGAPVASLAEGPGAAVSSAACAWALVALALNSLPPAKD